MAHIPSGDIFPLTKYITATIELSVTEDTTGFRMVLKREELRGAHHHCCSNWQRC